MNPGEPIRTAVIGAGHWGPNLIRNFDNPPASVLRMVVDRDGARLQQVRARFPGAAVSQDAADAFRDPEVDAVVIATPTSSHYALVKAALEAGKHVLVEKPITTHSGEADELVTLAERRQRVLVVGHVFIFNLAVQRVRAYITAGDLGRIYYISMVRTNLGPIRIDVNAAWDLMSHDISIVNYWLSAEPETASAVGGTWINAGREDAVFATLRYPGEVLVNVHASWLNPRKSRDVTVAGDKRMLTFDDMNILEPLRLYDKQVSDQAVRPDVVDTFASFRASIRDGDITIPKVSAGEPLRNECEHFLDCIRTGRRPLVGGAEGAAVVRALEAIDRSMRDHGREQAVREIAVSGGAIPPVDLGAQHAAIADEVAAGFAAVLDKTAFILGPAVAAFETAYAAFIGARHCVGVANGTDALELALRAAGADADAEVLLPANTFIATALAVLRAGARPALVDCDPQYYLIDLEQAAARVTKRTRFLLPVHLYGQMAPTEKVEALARAHGLTVIEDAAQAQGARRHGRAAGTTGRAAGTSFYPGKNLGAYGDAGAVTTDDDAIAARVRALRNYGSEVKYHHPEIGFNSRLDTLQAVVLGAKLKRLAGWNEARRAAAHRYDELLADLPAVTRPRTLVGNEHVFHLYVVRVPNRDEVVKKLADDGIGAQIHYPVPIHLQGAFRPLGFGPGSFPVAERAAREILSLPIYPEITAEQQARVVASLRRALG